MIRIAGAIAKIKNNSEQLFDEQTIDNACRDVGYAWRKRILDPVATIRLFILQILHGNSACQGLIPIPRISD